METQRLCAIAFKVFETLNDLQSGSKYFTILRSFSTGFIHHK